MSDQAPIDDKDALLKEAAVALDNAQKRAGAEKLAFDLVERGKVPPFETFSEFEEKIASLMMQDLRVVEAALELDVDMPDFGKVAAEGGPPMDAATAFMHRIAED